MIEKVIIFGLGPLSKTIFSYSSEMSNIQIDGFMIDDEYYQDSSFCDLPVYKSSTLKNTSITKTHKFLLCIGYKHMRNRKQIFDRLQSQGCIFINFIHSTAHIPKSVVLGVNNIIFPQVGIEVNAHIGDNNIIWSQSLIGHNTIIKSHNYIAQQALIGGNSKMGNLCFFGNKTYTIDGLNIADETYLVAGCGLFTDTKAHCMYCKNPAIIKREHSENGIEIN